MRATVELKVLDPEGKRVPQTQRGIAIDWFRVKGQPCVDVRWDIGITQTLPRDAVVIL